MKKSKHARLLCVPRKRTTKKGTVILHAGDRTDRMGIVLSGSVTIENNDMWGNCTILSHVGTGQFFAETYALLRNEVLLVDVKANENCRILFLNVGSLLPDSPAAIPLSRDLKRPHYYSLAPKNSFHIQIVTPNRSKSAPMEETPETPSFQGFSALFTHFLISLTTVSQCVETFLLLALLKRKAFAETGQERFCVIGNWSGFPVICGNRSGISERH